MARCKFLFGVLFWLWSLGVDADIGVSPIIVDLQSNDVDAEIAVRNLDTKHNAYVEITPYLLANPANHTAPKKRVGNPARDGLIVFPAKLVLLPGQTQFVRIVKTAKTLAKDQVYEVDFIPKISTHLVEKAGSNGVTLGIRVIVGYGARVILRPDRPAPTLVIQRRGDELLIKNTGNTALKITSCSQQRNNKKVEISLPAYTLFAGQTLKQKLIRRNRVTVEAAFMGKAIGPFYTD